MFLYRAVRSSSISVSVYILIGHSCIVYIFLGGSSKTESLRDLTSRQRSGIVFGNGGIVTETSKYRIVHMSSSDLRVAGIIGNKGPRRIIEWR